MFFCWASICFAYDFPVDMFGECGVNMMMAMTYYIKYIMMAKDYYDADNGGDDIA